MISWGKALAIGALVAGGGLAFVKWPLRVNSPATITVKIPAEFEARARAGKVAFDTNCASCHGPNAAGTDRGPPLVHKIYNPGHHSDQAFLLAVKIGVRSHHWNFGDMPPQPQVEPQQLADILAYVRALQEANGIVYQPHRM